MDFEKILLLLTLVTGGVFVYDRLLLRPQRRRTSESLGAPVAEPAWLEYSAGLFPVIFLVFVVRSFIYEPFNIPSGSMIPTLRIGDLILVEKFRYGIRLPVGHQEVINTGRPDRGDVVVFRYPSDPDVDYIKRVIGVPGDVVRVREGMIQLNGDMVSKPMDAPLQLGPGEVFRVSQEKLGNASYLSLRNAVPAPTFAMLSHPHREFCEQTAEVLSCKVPAGHYFVMGDNRDNSADSRIWGFVPEGNLVGRAVVVWFNASEVFSGRWGRLGSIH